MSSLANMWNGGYHTKQSMRGLGPQRPLRDCNIEEIHARSKLIDPSSALLFDKKDSGQEKRRMRDLVLELCGPEKHPEPIKILTMPASRWKFEATLSIRREGRFRECENGPIRTTFHCVENDRTIYYKALCNVPGITHPNNVIKDIGKSKLAERTLSYLFIDRYYFTDVDALMQETDEQYDCVWLDYLGPLTLKRLELIKLFFVNNIKHTLVLTNLKGRWNKELGFSITQHNDYGNWLQSHFLGHTIEHYHEYFDTSPMVQIAISKR